MGACFWATQSLLSNHCPTYWYVIWVDHCHVTQLTLPRSVPSTSKEAIWYKRPCATKWGLTTEGILQWANRWSTSQENFIPKFKLARENEKPHILVVLNGKCGTLLWSEADCIIMHLHEMMILFVDMQRKFLVIKLSTKRIIIFLTTGATENSLHSLCTFVVISISRKGEKLHHIRRILW